MENRTRRMTYLGHIAEALKRTNGARHYALSDTERLALAALLSEWQAEQAGRGESFTLEAAAEFLEQLRDFTPSLFQTRPAEEKELPKLPLDPVSGQSPPNLVWHPAREFVFFHPFSGNF